MDGKLIKFAISLAFLKIIPVFVKIMGIFRKQLYITRINLLPILFDPLSLIKSCNYARHE